MEFDESTFEDGENERTKLNNEVIVPAYRQFCRENDLAFHFWDELPNEKFNPNIGYEEFKLHNEAMNCFNYLKPKFVLFNNKIYTFHFTDWGGEFEFEVWEIEDFLNQAHEQVNRVSGLEKQLRSALSILEVMSAIIIIALTFLLGNALFAGKFDSPFLYLGTVVAIASIYFIKKKYFSNPLKKYSSEINKYINRLEALKQKFNPPTIKNNQ